MVRVACFSRLLHPVLYRVTADGTCCLYQSYLLHPVLYRVTADGTCCLFQSCLLHPVLYLVTVKKVTKALYFTYLGRSPH